MAQFEKGQCANPETQFKKGCIPWNKGKKGYKVKTGNYNKKSGFQEGHANYHKECHTWSMESRINKSLEQTGDKKFTGFKRELRGRIMMMREYLEWRADVFKRDNYHCQHCGKKGYLEAHHIIAFSKLLKLFNITTSEQARKCKELWDIGNGITYCKPCHILLDENIGKRGLGIKLKLNNTGG